MAGTNPRAVRIAGLVQRVIAQSLEHELHDKRLTNVTITEVRVTNDMQLARVYWTQLGDKGKESGQRRRAKQALEQAKGRLRSHVGAKAGLRLTPVLEFHYDEVPSEATEIEDVLAVALKRDQELAKMRESAQYAGDADPYRHDDEPSDEDGWDDGDDWDDEDDADIDESDGGDETSDEEDDADAQDADDQTDQADSDRDASDHNDTEA